MKNTLCLILCLAFHGVFAQEAEVRKAVETFFEGFHAKDTIKLRSVCKEELVLHSVTVKKDLNEFKIENVSNFLKTIASIPNTVRFEEKILSYKIQTDGVIAHVWTPYEFHLNGKLIHSGVNSFQLVKDKGLWKITYCIDTRKRSEY